MSDLFTSAPGATPFDADGLIDPDIHSKKDLDEAEAAGILRARNKHLRKTRKPGWFTSAYVKRVHGDMFQGVWSWAGRYRDPDAKINMGVPFQQIPLKVEELCRDVAFWASQKINTLSYLEQAVRIHHRLVEIHPFRNGNGRHARLLSDIFLYAHQLPLPQWPYQEMIDEGSPRSKYIVALRAADHGDLGPLIQYTQKYLPTKTRA